MRTGVPIPLDHSLRFWDNPRPLNSLCARIPFAPAAVRLSPVNVRLSATAAMHHLPGLPNLPTGTITMRRFLPLVTVVGAVLAGCAHLVETRTVTAFMESLEQADLEGLRDHASNGFRSAVLRRDDALERRRPMMEAWARFVCGADQSNNVVQIKRKRRTQS